MITNSIKKYILRTAAFALPLWGLGSLTSCEDMMTVDTGDKAYVNAQDTLYSYLGIMRALQDVAERQVILGEIRGDLVTSTDYTTDTLYAISNFEDPKDLSCSMLKVSDYYNVINNCNFYIHNADTAAVKSNIQYMKPEFAQVKAVRAWAYLQLVKNYKEVPYITEPINNLSVIENFDYAGHLVNKDNLVDLIEADLADVINEAYPKYGSPSESEGKWNNGYTDISTHLLMIPMHVVLGDLYLLRGASTSDYEKAAKHYYEYLKNAINPLPDNFCTASKSTRNNSITYNTYSQYGWGGWAATYTYNSSNEVISLIPSSANAGLGKMLTRVADIYGYTPSSSQSSANSTETNDAGETVNKTDANGNDVYEESGAISVSKNYKRQYGPSNAFQDVVNQQTYVTYNDITRSYSYIENCDARYGSSVEDLAYEGEGYPLCCKAAYGSAFFYTIPIYRKTLVWLRLAEAINRMGYPEFAFSVLKEGLNQYTLPRIVDRFTLGDSIPVYDEDGETILSYDRDTIRFKALDYGTYGAMYYVTDTTRLNTFNGILNFKDDIWNPTYGIHAKGTGFGTTWTSANDFKIITCIGGYHDSVYYDYYKLIAKDLNPEIDLQKTPRTEIEAFVANADINDVINAVENIIVDELALETAFEGNRFTDLVRIAEHKNIAGYNGTEWLAQKIANRGTKAATSTSIAVDGYDATLYNKLKNPALWYFTLPAWTTK